MSYYLFCREDNYEQGSLGDHLDYLDTWGGTPDCWDIVDGTLNEAKQAARESGLEEMYIVDEYTCRVVYIHKDEYYS